jgi:hypothetical protein
MAALDGNRQEVSVARNEIAPEDEWALFDVDGKKEGVLNDKSGSGAAGLLASEPIAGILSNSNLFV